MIVPNKGVLTGLECPFVLVFVLVMGMKGRYRMRKNYSREDILKLVEEEDVEFIRLQFTDIFGSLKNVAVTSAQLKKALDNQCTFDASSIAGFMGVEESDMYLYPDYGTLEIFPWRPQQGKVARLICDVYRPDRKPFAGDPRYVLKRALAEAEELGLLSGWVRSANFSCFIWMTMACRLRSVMKTRAILTWVPWILERTQDGIWC